MNKVVFISLGSNLNQPLVQLSLARDLIEKKISRIQQASSIYQTEAWGLHAQPDYYNQIIRLSTRRPAPGLLSILLGIEKSMGRLRTGLWEPRIIDLDILFYGQEHIISKNLVIPHPRLHERLFNLVPMMELAPNWIHPVLKKSMSELTRICTDNLQVNKLD